MHGRIVNWDWACAFCHIRFKEYNMSFGMRCCSVQNCFLILLVSSSPEHCFGPMLSNLTGCPRQQCWWCCKAPIVYPYHPRCANTILQFLDGQKILGCEWLLRFAQAITSAPISKNEYEWTPLSLTDAFHVSFQKIMDLVSPDTGLALSLKHLQRLPPEIQAYIFSSMLESPGGHVLFCGKALDILAILRSWPEKTHRSVSCNGALFARWHNLEETPHLVGLYDMGVQDSIQIKAENEDWDFISLQMDNNGITSITFSTDEVTPIVNKKGHFTQILHRSKSVDEKIWMTLEVVYPTTQTSRVLSKPFLGTFPLPNRYVRGASRSSAVE
jgi:hypothetical protein